MYYFRKCFCFLFRANFQNFISSNVKANSNRPFNLQTPLRSNKKQTQDIPSSKVSFGMKHPVYQTKTFRNYAIKEEPLDKIPYVFNFQKLEMLECSKSFSPLTTATHIQQMNCRHILNSNVAYSSHKSTFPQL